MLVKHWPHHIRFNEALTHIPLVGELDHSEAIHGLEFPHFIALPENGMAAIIMSDQADLSVGDEITTMYGGTMIVKEVVERRKAKGDWATNPFCTTPDFVRIKY